MLIIGFLKCNHKQVLGYWVYTYTRTPDTLTATRLQLRYHNNRGASSQGMEQSAIPFNELVPTLRKRVHNCFLTWHRFAMVRHLKMKCAVRSESLNRGISAFKQLLMRRRARRHFQRSVMARAVKHWRSVAAAQSPPPLQRGMQVLFCYKMLSHSCQDGPTHKFPWLGNAGSVDETGSRIAAVRYRNYVMGRLVSSFFVL